MLLTPLDRFFTMNIPTPGFVIDDGPSHHYPKPTIYIRVLNSAQNTNWRRTETAWLLKPWARASQPYQV